VTSCASSVCEAERACADVKEIGSPRIAITMLTFAFLRCVALRRNLRKRATRLMVGDDIK